METKYPMTNEELQDSISITSDNICQHDQDTEASKLLRDHLKELFAVQLMRASHVVIGEDELPPAPETENENKSFAVRGKLFMADLHDGVIHGAWKAVADNVSMPDVHTSFTRHAIDRLVKLREKFLLGQCAKDHSSCTSECQFFHGGGIRRKTRGDDKILEIYKPHCVADMHIDTRVG